MKYLSSNILILSILISSSLYTSCSSDSPVIDEPEPHPPGKPIVEVPKPDYDSMKNGDKLQIYYSEDGGKNFIGQYNAVKIGEYLWMNSNFTAPDEGGHGMTQQQINTGLSIYRIDTLKYKLTPYDINKYIGQYYSLARIKQMHNAGNMYEGSSRINYGKWGLPSAADFRQLFAMCEDGQEYNVRRHLTYKVGEIPIAKTSKNIFWMTSANTNKYGFNLLYGGQRAHSDDYPWGTCHEDTQECFQFKSKRGDFVIFYATAVFPTKDGHTVMLHDYPDTRRGEEWAWKNMRWCRRLTNEELGYRLYVNKDRSDIIKLDVDESAPKGYEELPNGYLRGFYVQYILNNPNPTKTVSQLRDMELKLPEVMYGTSPT